MSLRSEILEQPALLANAIAGQRAAAAEIAAGLGPREPRWVLIAARGSSDNAALYAKYLWGSRNRLAVALAAPSLFTVYQRPPRLAGALVVGISQSGRSPDIVRVLEEARRQGAPTLAITNERESPLARAAEWVFELGTGVERSIAATKTYTAQLCAIALLSLALDEDPAAAAELARVPELFAAALADERAIADAAAERAGLTECVVLGRGFDFSTAWEWALKLKELTYVLAAPYSSADFRHGPVAIVDRNLPLFAVAPRGAAGDDVLALCERLVRERGADLLALTNDERARALARRSLELPAALPEWLAPLVTIAPAQLFTYHLAVAMGLDPEEPRGLRKVTETW